MADNNIEQKTENTTETTSIKDRLKSWAVWLSILGAVGIILSNTGVFDKIGIDGATWDIIINAVGAVLVGFGILNNPTDKKKF